MTMPTMLACIKCGRQCRIMFNAENGEDPFQLVRDFCEKAEWDIMEERR